MGHKRGNIVALQLCNGLQMVRAVEIGHITTVLTRAPQQLLHLKTNSSKAVIYDLR
jgi:hypothetical protein